MTVPTQPGPSLTAPQPWAAPLAPVPIRATVSLPGSKSETNRALLLAALANAPSTIRNGLEARDTRLMRQALRALGVLIDEDHDGWHIQPPGQFSAPAEIDCGLAGTVMRFVPALAALATGTVRFVGDPVIGSDGAATSRPMRPLLDGLRSLGVVIDGDALPFTLTGNPRLVTADGRSGSPHEVEIDASTSSQYVSALLLVGARLAGGLALWHSGGRLPSKPHIDMTVGMLRARGVQIDQADPAEGCGWRVHPGEIQAVDISIAPDLSNAAPFLAAAAVTHGEVTILGWPTDTDQPGDQLRHILRQFGADVDFDDSAGPDGGLTVTGKGRLNGIDADLSEASELTPVVAAVAALADSTSKLTGIGHIRGHETDRLAALRRNIEALGGKVTEHADGITIHPRLLRSGDWSSFADHRVAQAGAVIGLLIDDLVIDDIDCTAKTMPDFPSLWQDMIDAAVESSNDEMVAETPGHGDVGAYDPVDDPESSGAFDR